MAELLMGAAVVAALTILFWKRPSGEMADAPRLERDAESVGVRIPPRAPFTSRDAMSEYARLDYELYCLRQRPHGLEPRRAARELEILTLMGELR